MPDPTSMLWVPAGAFGAVLLAAYAVYAASTHVEAPEDAPPQVVQPDIEPSLALRWAGALAMPEDPYERARDRRLLAQASLSAPGALAAWYAARTLLALGLPAAVWLWMPLPTTTREAALMLVAAAAGYYGPVVFVEVVRSGRRARLQRSVPNLLDMLVSCLEAGLGTDAAFRYVSREVQVSSVELADELDRANAEMSAGVPRQEALRRLDERTGVEEIGALVSVLGQAERFGAGVAPSLRAHAQLARRRRALRAEQRAAQASPLLTVVMIVFILPALFVVLLGPTLVQVVERFLPAVSGAA